MQNTHHQSKQIINKPQFTTLELPIRKLSLSAEVPNFKADADANDGVVKGNQLHGTYQRLGTAPIVVWHRLNGAYEIITGRHRFDLAKRTSEKTIPSHIVEESEGFTAEMAKALDAECNIRDGQGTIKDFVIYFDSCTIDEATAQARGLLSRKSGQTAWAIAKFASEDTRCAWENNRITATQAAVIANGAQDNEPLQRQGIEYARKHTALDAIALWLTLLATKSQPMKQIDLFTSSVSYSKAAMYEAKQMLNERKNITQTLHAIEGPAAAPKLARKNGVRIRNCKKTKAQIEALKKRVAKIDALTKVSRVKHERWDAAQFDGSDN